jgi:hypothetical protein
MKILSRKWLRLTSIVILAIAVLAVLWVFQLWNSPPDAQSVIAQSEAAIKEVKSCRLSFTGQSTGSNGLSQSGIEAEYLLPDRYHAVMSEDGETNEFILIGDVQYFPDGHSPGGAAAFGLSHSFTSIFNQDIALQYLDSLAGAQNLQNEPIKGVNCYHYLGKWNVEKQIAETKKSLLEAQTGMGITPDEQDIDLQLAPMRSMEMNIELWIGKDDYLIRQMQMKGKIPDDPEASTFNQIEVTLTYYDFNQTITIEPPLDSSGRLLPGWRQTESNMPDPSPKPLAAP